MFVDCVVVVLHALDPGVLLTVCAINAGHVFFSTCPIILRVDNRYSSALN